MILMIKYILVKLVLPQKKDLNNIAATLKKNRCEKRPLYAAMNKYGIEHFHVDLVGEYSDNDLEEYEIY